MIFLLPPLFFHPFSAAAAAVAFISLSYKNVAKKISRSLHRLYLVVCPSRCYLCLISRLPTLKLINLTCTTQQTAAATITIVNKKWKKIKIRIVKSFQLKHFNGNSTWIFTSRFNVKISISFDFSLCTSVLMQHKTKNRIHFRWIVYTWVVAANHTHTLILFIKFVIFEFLRDDLLWANAFRFFLSRSWMSRDYYVIA